MIVNSKEIEVINNSLDRLNVRLIELGGREGVVRDSVVFNAIYRRIEELQAVKDELLKLSI